MKNETFDNYRGKYVVAKIVKKTGKDKYGEQKPSAKDKKRLFCLSCH